MTYSKEELYNIILNNFTSTGVEGELPKLIAKVSSEYLFLHQSEDLGILMENSFSRSKLLNSRIQHAVDNFYSVNRGTNRIISVNNAAALDTIDVKKFDFISTYGNYKLFYYQDYTHTALYNLFSFKAYLALDCVEKEIKGSNKLYLDIDDENISEDIIIMRVSDGKIFKISSNIADLYNEDESFHTDICTMTMPNYSVRLWSPKGFPSSETYKVKYLKSPEKSIKDLNLDDIKSIPGYSKSSTFEILDYSMREDKLDDNDKIYLYTSNYVRFKDTMKSVGGIENLISEAFPEIIGFNFKIEDKEINIYYTTSYDETQIINPEKIKKFNKKMKAYYINQVFNFMPAVKVEIEKLNLTVSYKKELNFTKCESIIKSYQSQVGENFNPYQLIADIMSDESLIGYIKRVELPQDLMDIIELSDNERIHYKELSITYTAVQ